MKQFLLFSAFILFFLSPIFSFSQAYKVDEMRIYDWDAFSVPADWKQNTTEQFTYDNGGNKETNILGLSYPSLDKMYQLNKTYNANNDVILVVNQGWNSTLMQWEDEAQNTYTYYAGTSNVKDITFYVFSLGYDTFKISYEYSGTDIIKLTFQDGSSGTLVNDQQYVFTYNSPGFPQTEDDYEWNTVTGMWEKTERGTAIYTAGLFELTFEQYNGTTWDLYERYLKYYTISIEKENEYIQQSRVGSDWVNSDRELSIYDSNDNKKEYIWYDWVSDAWSPYYKEEKDYSVAAALSTEFFNSENFKIYPNPVSDVLNISFSLVIDNIEIYNVLGKKVKQATNTKQINVESLKSGIYVLKVFSDNRSVCKKIVIK